MGHILDVARLLKKHGVAFQENTCGRLHFSKMATTIPSIPPALLHVTLSLLFLKGGLQSWLVWLRWFAGLILDQGTWLGCRLISFTISLPLPLPSSLSKNQLNIFQKRKVDYMSPPQPNSGGLMTSAVIMFWNTSTWSSVNNPIKLRLPSWRGQWRCQLRARLSGNINSQPCDCAI